MTDAYVNLVNDDGIATIEFFHPTHNSLPADILGKLTATIEQAGKDDTVRIVILKSGGDRSFCAGASFNELIKVDDAESGLAFFTGFANVINAMRLCPKLIIGRVQGKAVGGGVGLASATDYCMATRHAAIKLSELSIGIGPFVIGPAVERKIGMAAMSQVSIDATRFYDADWAHQKGLYTQLFDTTGELDEAVQTLAQRLAGYNPEAMLEMKRTFWRGTENWNELLMERAAISGRLVLSEFTRETLKHFA